MNIRKATPYDVGNLALSLGYAEKCGGVKPENGIPNSPSWELDVQRQYIYKQTIKKMHIIFLYKVT